MSEMLKNPDMIKNMMNTLKSNPEMLKSMSKMMGDNPAASYLEKCSPVNKLFYIK